MQYNKPTIIKTVYQKNGRLTFYRYASEQELKLPLLQQHIAAGFPSPADDYLENKLDLNDYMVKHPAATFFVHVEGDSMVDAGINSGDLLVVDRAIEPRDGSIVVAVINNEFTVKRVSKRGMHLYLVSENTLFAPIKITSEMDFEIWGVVTHAVHHIS